MKRVGQWLKRQRDEHRAWPPEWRKNMWLCVGSILGVGAIAMFAYRFAVAVFVLHMAGMLAVSVAFQYWRKWYLEKVINESLREALRKAAAGEFREAMGRFLEEHHELTGQIELVDDDGVSADTTKWKH